MHSVRPIGAALIMLPAMLLIGSNLINSSQRVAASKSQELQPSQQPLPIQKLPAVAGSLSGKG